MNYEWVKGRFEGERCKSVMAHAASGIGYVIMQAGKIGGTPFCVAAFKRPADSAIPVHLNFLNNYEIEKIEKKYGSR